MRKRRGFFDQQKIGQLEEMAGLEGGSEAQDLHLREQPAERQCAGHTRSDGEGLSVSRVLKWPSSVNIFCWLFLPDLITN